MKARVKGKQVEVMTDCVKQVIEINKSYHSKILKLKEQLQKKDAEIQHMTESGALLLKNLMESSKELTEINDELKKTKIELERERKEKNDIRLKMPIVRGNELEFGGVLYKKKGRFL